MNLKSILKFIFIFSTVYLFLIIPWGNMNTSYARFYAQIASACFNSIGENGYVDFEVKEDTDKDIKIRQANTLQANDKGQVTSLTYLINSKMYAFLPTSLLIALFLASPIKWYKKIWMFGFSFILLHSFLMLTLLVFIVYHFAHAPWLELFQFKNTNIIDAMNGIAENGMGVNSFVVIFIWLFTFIIFSKKELNTLFLKA